MSKVRLAKLTPAAMEYLRNLREFLGVTFTFKQEENKLMQKMTEYSKKEREAVQKANAEEEDVEMAEELDEEMEEENEELIENLDEESNSALAYHKPSQSPTKSIWQ